MALIQSESVGLLDHVVVVMMKKKMKMLKMVIIRGRGKESLH